ncbi:MAG: OsmC family peroxiredoxin, partial [Mesorhizobium sp.]
LSFDLDTDEPQERIDSLLKLTERYCVVFQTISNKPELTVSVKR